MVQENHMQVHFDAKSVNEGLARMVVTAFMTNMNPTLEQIADVKTAVSEAVTNAIIHGYEDETKQVELTCDQNGQQLVVTVEHPEGAAGRPEDQAADDNREYGAGLYGGETICKPGNRFAGSDTDRSDWSDQGNRPV